VKFSLPNDVRGLRAAERLADSVLRSNSSANPKEPRLLAGLAALTGRAHLAARLSRHVLVQEEWGVNSALRTSGPALLVYSAMGGPPDSLRILEQQVTAAIAALPPQTQMSERAQWLALPAALAYPEYQFASIRNLPQGEDYLFDGLAAMTRGDTAKVRAALAQSKQLRVSIRPADLTLDALHLEASWLAAMGDPRAAGAWLDPTLESIAASEPQFFADAFRSGPLVRAMALRAELARRTGDMALARKWATPVAVLWRGADGFLQPIVRRMEVLGK
jgi:hypothetical protein